LEAQHTDLGLWKIRYKRISTIQIMTLTATGSSTLLALDSCSKWMWRIKSVEIAGWHNEVHDREGNV
jgi:hypothetical protein